MKKFDLGTIKVNMETNGFIKGLILKRELTTRECRYLLYNLLGIVISKKEDCYDAEEYKEYNQNLVLVVNKWLSGDCDDNAFMELAGDCADEHIGVFNLIPIIAYLKKKGIID